MTDYAHETMQYRAADALVVRIDTLPVNPEREEHKPVHRMLHKWTIPR
jgi:hypothetical protein